MIWVVIESSIFVFMEKAFTFAYQRGAEVGGGCWRGEGSERGESLITNS